MLSTTCKRLQKNLGFACKGDKYMPFPNTQAEINALLQIWLIKLPNWATLYGLSSDTVKQVQDDAIMYKHILDITIQLESDRQELSAYRENIFNGNPQSIAAAYPMVEISPLPALAVGVKPGITARNNEIYNFFARGFEHYNGNAAKNCQRRTSPESENYGKDKRPHGNFVQ
jgi:hypothetical protein